MGVAHVGYLPGDRILGLSKLARVVEHFARAPQVQERLTTQVAGWLSEHLGRHNESLPAGSLVLAGALTDAVPLVAGRDYRLAIETELDDQKLCPRDST